MLKILAILIALTSAVMTLQPPPTESYINRQGYVNVRNTKIRLEEARKAEEARKSEEAARQQPQDPNETVKSNNPNIQLSGTVVNQIVSYRTNNGYSGLIENSELAASAGVQTNQLNENNWWVHSRSGEIQGGNYGYADPETKMVQDWISSPPHHSIMIGAYSSIGCAKSVRGAWSWFVCHFQ